MSGGDSAEKVDDKRDEVEKLFSSRGVSSHDEGLKGDVDVFNGVNIRPHHLTGMDADSFFKRLAVSLDLWKQEGKRGIWIKIPTEQANLIPMATKSGFDFHHAKKGYVLMTKWLPDTPSTLPNYAHHNIGVAGFVVNEKNQLLVIQEKYLLALKRPIWKLPGGLGDPGEDISETAVREVREETGVETEFVSLLCFRHMHALRWGTDDIYFVCLLKPLTSEVNIDQKEIAASKWVDLHEYIADPNTTPTNRMIAESYLKCCKHGISFTPVTYPHFLENKPDLVFYSLNLFTPPFSRTLDHTHDSSDSSTTAGHKL